MAVTPREPGPNFGKRVTRADSLVTVTQRLYNDYREQASLVEIIRTIRECRRDLDIVAAASLPEMVERLARQRFADRTEPRPREGTS